MQYWTPRGQRKVTVSLLNVAREKIAALFVPTEDDCLGYSCCVSFRNIKVHRSPSCGLF
uniref:Uncharacterized protein n=1 Tax=Anguilla anguilla TaxID=7936 RepID=A0A0E9WYK5_ANGAN